MSIFNIVKKVVGMGLPALGTALGGPLGGVFGSLIGHALGLGSKPTSEQIGSAIDADPAGAKAKLLQIQNEHAEEMAQLSALQVQAQQTGQTMRVEYGSTDPFVRHWRPMWGYVSAYAWAGEALAIMGGIAGGTAAALMGHAKAAGLVLGSLPMIIGSMAALWAIALAVLGVSVVQRSKDKALQAGKEPQLGILGSLLKRIAK
jgi:hypothetical protein